LGNAQGRGLVAQNVAQPVKLEMPKRGQRKLVVGRDIPLKQEVQKLLANAGARLRPLLVTAVFTGMRGSQVRGLTWDDVDCEKKVVQVRQRANLWRELGVPKSHASEREIPMSPLVVNTLKEWRLGCPKGELKLVFPGRTGRVENYIVIYRGLIALQQA